MAKLSELKRQHSRAVMYILVSCLRGSSLQLAMNVEESNGLEAWRMLVKREEPTEGSTQVAQLMCILKTTFTGGVPTLVNELERLTGGIQRYEHQFNDLISDSVVQSIMKSNAPDDIKSHIALTSFRDSSPLKDALTTFDVTRDTTSMPMPGSSTDSGQQPAGGAGGQQPMDNGVLYV